MRNVFFCSMTLALMGLFFSCTSKPSVIPPAVAPPVVEQPTVTPPTVAPPAVEQPVVEKPVVAPPVIPKPPLKETVVPPVPETILGRGLVTQKALASFLLEHNPGITPDYARELAGYYIREAAAEGVNHDVAFVQMCLETGYLHFGNLVTPDMNNFCGLGAIDAENPGERFPDTQTGVRAHIQHLKGYATEAPLTQGLVDPRYRWVKKGSAPTIRGLTGKWATDPGYDGKINGILVRLYDFAAVQGDD